MKLAILNNLYPPNRLGGAEKSVELLATSLANVGIEVHVICFGQAGDSPRSEPHPGVTVHRLRLKNIYWFFTHEQRGAARRALWHAVDIYNPWVRHDVDRLLERIKPEVVHTNNLAGFSSSAWVAAARQKVGVVHTLRDYYLLCPAGSMMANGRRCVRQCAKCSAYSRPKRSLATLVEGVVGISEAILSKHRDHGYFPRAKEYVIPNPHGLASSVAPPVGARTSEGPLRLGYLGNLEQKKGTEWLLRQMQALRKDEVILDLAGKGRGEYEEHLRATYSGPNIRFHGWVDAGEFLSTIDILIVPSLWDEPMGRVVIEAFAQGRPVLVSNRGGLPELVQQDENGLIFDPEQPESFQRLVRRLSEDRAAVARLSDGAKLSHATYGVERIRDAYIGAYHDARARGD